MDYPRTEPPSQHSSPVLPLHETEKYSTPEECFDGTKGCIKWARNLASYSRILKTQLSRLAISLAPSPLLWYLGHSKAPLRTDSRTAYLDGIRGLAAFAVYVQHFATPFQPSMLGLLDAQTSWSVFQIFQLPILRVIYSGSFAVAVFFAISGFALSLRPLRMIRGQEPTKAIETIVSSALRRGPRIFTPPIVIVALMMLGTRLDLFNNDYPLSSFEKYNLEAPIRLSTFAGQLADSLQFVLTRVFYPSDWLQNVPFTSPGVYGFQLWTIPTEFWSSQLLFIGMIALAKCRRRYRNAIVIGFVLYSMWCMRWDISLFFCGMLLAEIEIHRTKFQAAARSRRLFRQGLPILIFVLGLYLGTTPDFNAESTPGFRWLASLVFYERLWQSVGAIQVIWAVSQSEALQSVFTSPTALWLGNISFALYLVHVPILSSHGWDIVPAIWSITGNDVTLNYETGVILGFLILCPVVLWLADIFWRLVDLPSVKLAKLIEIKIFASQSI